MKERKEDFQCSCARGLMPGAEQKLLWGFVKADYSEKYPKNKAALLLILCLSFTLKRIKASVVKSLKRRRGIFQVVSLCFLFCFFVNTGSGKGISAAI